MKLSIILILTIGSFALGLLVSILVTPDTPSPDLYARKDIPTSGYKSY